MIGGSRKPKARHVTISDAAQSASVSSDLASQVVLDQVVLDPILTLNSNGVIQSASDSVEHVFGWTPTELYGRNFSELVPEPKRSALDKYLDRYRKPGPPKVLTRSHRFDAQRKDGTPIRIELSLSRADLPSLASSYFVGIVRDVSRSIEIDTNSMVERSHLQNLITEQTRALATAHLRLLLAERLSALGTLSAGLGHDMNNVLLPVRARLNVLENSGLSESSLSHVAVIRNAVSYLQHLCEGLQYLAPDQEPKEGMIRQDATDLRTWWSQVGPLLRLAIPTGITFSSSFEPGLPPVMISTHSLTQAVLNFVVNAGEAVYKGMRESFVRVAASLSEDGLTVKLSITDNGRGMTHAVSRHAFDLFFTTKSRHLGTGLGLPLARKVIVRAGGSVELSSHPRKGTTVIVTLPVARRTQSRHFTAADKAVALSATISLKSPRLTALYSQILISAGISVTATTVEHSAVVVSDFWFTKPTPGVLARVTRWRKKYPDRTVVCVGVPPRKDASMWEAVNAIVLTPPDDFQAIRTTVLMLVSTLGARPTSMKT